MRPEAQINRTLELEWKLSVGWYAILGVGAGPGSDWNLKGAARLRPVFKRPDIGLVKKKVWTTH
jgi:hypothetical protein